MPLKEA